jgi:5'-3' exonuclease
MTIAIIDGDVLCYQACKPRWEKKARIEDGVSFITLDDDGKRLPLEWTKEEDRRYLEESWENLQKDLVKLLDKVYCDEYLMAVKGGENFRNLLYPEYKLNRHADPNKQNHFVPVLRKLAVAQELAVEATGREADDLMRMWAEEARESGDDYIVCSIDKDLKCIPGRHYLMHKDSLIEVSEEAALRHYYEQLLKGDPTDNIPGVPRVGEVKARKILEPFNTEDEFQVAVVDKYIEAYQDDWLQYLLSNGKMIYLQKKKDDYFSVRDWGIVKELGGL